MLPHTSSRVKEMSELRKFYVITSISHARDGCCSGICVCVDSKVKAERALSLLPNHFRFLEPLTLTETDEEKELAFTCTMPDGEVIGRD